MEAYPEFHSKCKNRRKAKDNGCSWSLERSFLCESQWLCVALFTYYARWRDEGVLKKIHDFLVTQVRLYESKKSSASVLIIDGQSTKAHWGATRGWDGFKKVRGRKRSIFVDTLGMIHSVYVDAADRKDHISALSMLNPETSHFPQSITYPLAAVLADGGYKAHDFQNLVQTRFDVWPTLTSSATKKEPNLSRTLLASNLKPTRWIVERTFGWFNHYRRLSRDYERKTNSSETMIHVAMTQLMLNRLSRPKEAYARWN